MRREAPPPRPDPVRLAQLVRSFHMGGTEGQLVELLRGLPPTYCVQVAAVSFVGPLTERVAELGYVPEEFPLSGSVARSGTLLQLGRMARWLKRGRTRLVHAHDFYGAVLGVPAAKLAGAKVVVGRLDLAHWHSPLQRAVLTRWTRLADRVVVNARAIAEQLVQEEGIPAERISLIPNGLDLPRFDARAGAGIEAPLPDTGGEPFVVHVANMNHPVKRQEDLLHALRVLDAKGVPCHVFFVGDGPRRPLLEALAAELGVARRAHFLGRRGDVPAICRRARAGVLCSSHEGLSNAVMEGMAAGIPMVVTRVGGSPDLVQDEETGRVVDPLSPAALARALEAILGQPEAAARMGLAARRFVEQSLTLEEMVRRHDALYRSLLE